MSVFTYDATGFVFNYVSQVYFKTLFYNKNTWLYIGREVILLGGELETFSVRENHWNIFLWIKNSILLMPVVVFEPIISQSVSGDCPIQVSPPP